MTQNNTQTDLCTCGHAQEHHFNGQCLELAARTRLCPCTQYQARDAVSDTIAALQARIRELEIQKQAAIRTFHEIEQALGRALHYPRYSDDQENFPGATEADGACIGDHVPETLAAEAAQRIATLEAEAKDTNRFLANESLVRENDALKQRIAELEAAAARAQAQDAEGWIPMATEAINNVLAKKKRASAAENQTQS